MALKTPPWRNWLNDMIKRSTYCEYLDSDRSSGLGRAILNNMSTCDTAEVSIFSTLLRVTARFYVHWDPILLISEWEHSEVDMATILGRI